MVGNDTCMNNIESFSGFWWNKWSEMNCILWIFKSEMKSANNVCHQCAANCIVFWHNYKLNFCRILKEIADYLISVFGTSDFLYTGSIVSLSMSKIDEQHNWFIYWWKIVIFNVWFILHRLCGCMTCYLKVLRAKSLIFWSIGILTVQQLV